MSEFCTGDCLGCRNVDMTIEMDESLRAAENSIKKAVLGDSLDNEIAPALFHALSTQGIMPVLPGSEGPVESPEELAEVMRMQSGAILEAIAEKRESLAFAVTALTNKCAGPLRMRATRDGKTVTTTVCMSPTAPLGTVEEQIYVNRN